jgi:hypothetical protein
MHAGTDGGGADEPDPDGPGEDDHQQCEEEGGGGGGEEAAASPSVDVRHEDNEAAADLKPSAKAASAAKGMGSGDAVKRKKPKPKHQRSQKPEGYPSRNRYARESCAKCVDRRPELQDPLTFHVACSQELV